MGNAFTKLVAGVTPSSPPPSVHWKGYKPDSVIDSHLSMRPVPAALTPNRFGALTRAASRRLFGLAPDEVFRAADITIGAVGSYPAISPLPAPEADEAGGLFSVALSVNPTLHRAALACERHRALWSLDFPPSRNEFRTAAIRPSKMNVNQTTSTRRQCAITLAANIRCVRSSRNWSM